MRPPVIQPGVDGTVVSTDSGHPVAVFVQVDGRIIMKSAGDADFNDTLQLLGFSKRKPVEVVSRRVEDATG